MRPELWYVYECSPIDFWLFTATVEEHLRRVVENGENEDLDETLEVLAAEVRRGVLAIASRSGWEGDGALRVGALPDPETFSMRPFVIVKQKSNGVTFVASRRQIPWLDGGYCGHTTASPTPLRPAIAGRLQELDELEARLRRERLPVC